MELKDFSRSELILVISVQSVIFATFHLGKAEIMILFHFVHHVIAVTHYRFVSESRFCLCHSFPTFTEIA